MFKNVDELLVVFCCMSFFIVGIFTKSYQTLYVRSTYKIIT